MARQTNLYKSYVFKEKDPIIDALRTAYEDAGGSYKSLSARSSVSYSTIHNWFNGKTRRPQFATVSEFAIACGKHGIVFGANGQPRLIGRVTPAEQRAWTGKRRAKRA
jgi:Helix-turn-helix